MQPAQSAPALGATAFRKVIVRRQSLQLELPEASAWKSRRSTSWWSVEHQESGSRLELKHWHEGQLVDAHDCEQQARRWRPEFERFSADQLVTTEPIEAPASFRGQLLVGAWPAEGAAHGALLLFSAHLRECVALHFYTRSLGPNAAVRVGKSLATIAQHLVPSLKVSRMSDRVSDAPAR